MSDEHEAETSVTMEAVQAMRDLTDAMQRACENGARSLVPPGRTATTIAWEAHRNGDMSVVITLDNGDAIRGRGPGKLEALVAAESALG